MRKWLLVYSFKNYSSAGVGRTFGTADGDVTEALILDWERKIKEANHFENVFITSFQELAA